MSATPAPWPVGRTFVVTGATSGIGLEIARGLAHAQAYVVVVGRDATRCAQVVEELRQAHGPTSASSATADLASQAQVRALADDLLTRFPSIHGLINNAGAVFSQRRETVDGIEQTFALNVLAPFLLTRLLTDRLRSSAPARVVNVASAAHRGVSLDLDDLEARRGYSGFGTYSRSKLALVLLSYEFARRLAGSRVTVNAVHPGFVRSGFGMNNPGGLAWGIRLAGIFAISVSHGARTPLYAATTPELEGVSGQYFSGERAVDSSPQSKDVAAAGRLWDFCSQRVGLAAPIPAA